MFRPDPSDQPRWMGNLKQYQLILQSGSVVLGDSETPAISAVNTLTGFITPCAASFWTNDTGTYWKYDPSDTPPAKGLCGLLLSGHSSWSDFPDGPIVEKGGVAEIIREGNNPPTTSVTPTWSPLGRTLWTSTLASNSLVPFTSASLGATNTTVAQFIMGYDTNGENLNALTYGVRPSVHGDEIHSRPLPVDYGGTTGVTVFYGANDGMLRAVDASTGRERWAFIAPEFYATAPQVLPANPTGFGRLMNDLPLINYFNLNTTGITPPPTNKDYYFDGSLGLYQTANNSSVFIYPVMRRGGRTIYAFDVTDPAAPAIKWKAGCPYPQGNNAGCTAGLSGIGETWSTPAAANTVNGYSSPVIIVGGGYDTCEDANVANPATTANPSTPGFNYCAATPQGAGIYVFDAATGAQKAILTAPGMRSIAADVALISYTMPGVVDHAYAVDTGGQIWRIDFGSNIANWKVNLVAYTSGAGRKFLFAPALLAAPSNSQAATGQVYVAVGSGDREHPLQSEYPYSGVVNRFYVYKDNLSSAACQAQACAVNLDGATMENFTWGPGDPGPGGQMNGTTCSTNGVVPGTTNFDGWYIDLNQTGGLGEQTVTSPIIAAGMVAFSTNRPVPSVAGSCSNNLGNAYGYWLNLFNASGGIQATGQACGGVRDAPFIGGGLPPTPVIATVPVGGEVVTVAIGAASLNGGTSCGICSQQVNPSIVPTRKALFWKGSGEN
jgi:type IV pilus assembly protein PilY1